MIFKSLIAGGGYKILGGLYLGWGIGANDSANIFGTAVATNVIRYSTAIILIAIFVIIGSMVEGPDLYENMTFSSAEATSNLALAATLAAALTVTLVTFLSIPTSTSQAAIGAFMGIAIASSGVASVEWNKFIKMLICWIVNPIACIIIGIILLKTIGDLISKTVKSQMARDQIYKFGLIIFGCYGAYALGANNVVVTTAPYYHAGMFGPVGSKAAFWAATVGGISIAIGALTYSRKVMATIGKKITPLSPFSALIVVMTHSLALHFFTWLKIPVSSSQAVVGAVIGVGIYHGAKTINKKTMAKIFAGWFITPLIAGLLAFGFFYVFGA